MTGIMPAPPCPGGVYCVNYGGLWFWRGMADGYPCGTSDGHCYAQATWVGSQPIQGAQTTLNLQHLRAGDAQVTTEMWMDAPTPPGKGCHVFGLAIAGCWVELGTIGSVDPRECLSDVPQCYFWADTRPCAPPDAVCPATSYPNGYFEHYFGTPDPSDYGQSVQLSIRRTDSTTFQVVYTAYRTNNNGFSYNNTMTPDTMQIGEEIAGHTGASVPYTDFTGSAYIGSDGQFHEQTATPTTEEDYPTVFGLNSVPSPDNPGGDIMVGCTCG